MESYQDQAPGRAISWAGPPAPSAARRPGTTLLEVDNLSVSFQTAAGRLPAVDGVSFQIARGEVLGLVGESGCGKSVTAHSLLRLIPSPPGRIERGRVHYAGRDLLKLPLSELRRIRGHKISMIFQDPLTALSPLQRIGAQLTETLRLHQRIGRRAAWQTGMDWLTRVGLADPAARMLAYPHQCSGGMRQRVMIAMALMLGPDLIIADEPATALDLTIQAQIFELMLTMKERRASILLISHDLGVVEGLCDRVLVMYASRLVEEAPTPDLFANPLHPYTRALLNSIPARQSRGGRLAAIPGQVPSPLHYPRGCHFQERCPLVSARCRMAKPALVAMGSQRRVACFRAGLEGI